MALENFVYRLFAIAALLPVGTLCGSGGEDWNRFRGPDGSGVAESARPPVKLDANRLAWKVPLPPGLSSPVLARNRVFLTGIDGNRFVTVALNVESGKLVWRREAPDVPLEKVHQVSSPAAPTPVVDDGRVYVYFGSFGLLCYDHDGRELWRKPIPTPKSLYGTATSPILHDEKLILVLDDDSKLSGSELKKSRVIALNKHTGEAVWETARPLMGSGWSTPTVWNYEGGGDLVVLGSGRVCGYDPDTGAERWFATGFSRETIALPVAGNGHVYVAAAMLGGVADEQPDPEPFWQSVLRLDANGDGKFERAEITEHFTFPLRPELPLGHPGFGIPLPREEKGRKERQNGMFDWIDKDRDGYWTHDEFVANMSFRRGKPRLLAIRPGGSGDITDSHVSWELNRDIPEIPSPLVYKDRLYLVRNGGLLAAVDVSDGNVLYRERLGAPGQYSASPVVANDHLYLVSNRGVVSVVKTGDAFQLVHQQDLGEPAFVTPAFDAVTIYFRTESNLLAFRSGD